MSDHVYESIELTGAPTASIERADTNVIFTAAKILRICPIGAGTGQAVSDRATLRTRRTLSEIIASQIVNWF
jgi:hypothetical protein